MSERCIAVSCAGGTPYFTQYTSAGNPPAPASTSSLLATYFDEAPPRSDSDRIHALIDPTCAGLPSLIRDYNARFPAHSALRLEDPDHMLAIPDLPP
jgi:hypothetical protein